MKTCSLGTVFEFLTKDLSNRFVLVVLTLKKVEFAYKRKADIFADTHLPITEINE